MKLKHLRLEHVRQFREPIEISDFAPGINLFSGPNESGKSTLVRAIRAAFFERHRSSSVKDLQPWGDSGAAPQVALAFDWQGVPWTLNKRFLKTARCDLRVGAETLNGEDAEDRLAQLLGFAFPTRGQSKPEHWGIPGLLWIEQGEGQSVRTSVEHAGAQLKSALGSSVGEVASSTGDALTAEVQLRRSRLLTATGRATGELLATQQLHDELQAEHTALAQKIDSYRADVDRLGALTRAQAQDEAERPWLALRAQAQAAREQLEEVARWGEARRSEEQRLNDCRRQLELVRAQLNDFEAQAGALRAREQADEKARAAVEAQRAAPMAAQARAEVAQQDHARAREAVQAARVAERRATLQSDRAQLDARLSQAKAQLDKARERQQALDAARLQAQAVRIDAQAVKRLLKLNSELERLRVRQDLVATRLRFDLLPGITLTLGSEPVSGRAERLLSTPTDLAIAGIGTLRITPGGDELSELALQQQRAQDALDAALSALAVPGVEAAQAREQQFNEQTHAVALLEAALLAQAPQGLQALQSALSLDDARLQTLDAELAELPVPQEEGAVLPHVKIAEQREQAAAQALSAAQAESNTAQQALRLAEQAAEAAARELAQSQAALNAPERAQREAQSQTQWTTLRADEAGMQARVQALAGRIDAARPDILAQDMARFEASAAQYEKDAEARRLELASLRGRIESAGAQGLEETLADCARRLDDAARRRNELQRQAGALDLLATLLHDERQAVTRQLQAPLQKHLNRYLQLLFAQSSLSVDENLVPGQLTRTRGALQEVGDFEALSFGAREQMGLISRLAYADLLQEAGRPTLVMLDDALVHSDAGRLAQMKRILFDAGQRHQILLFTCHPENWRDLGVAARDIASFRSTERPTKNGVFS